MNKAYLLTGGNLGNRLYNLETAAELIKKTCGKIVNISSVYQTAAWGFKEQPDFYNQALCLATDFSALQLMESLLSIEEKMGRRRQTKMGPRIIDIDILLFNSDTINLPGLTIPHPRLHDRRFALIPLHEIAPDVTHPVMHKTISQLLNECSDTLDVYKINSTGE